MIYINSYNNSNTENLENWKSKIIKDSSNLNSSKNIEDEKEYENLNFKVSNQNEHNKKMDKEVNSEKKLFQKI